MKSSLAILLVALSTTVGNADQIAELLSVGKGASGASEARQASRIIIDGGAKNLVPVLRAFTDATPLSANWLRNVFEAIADAEIRAGRPLPKDELLTFIGDTSQSPTARRLAYEWLTKTEPDLGDQLIHDMLADPSPEFRRDAVAAWIDKADEASGQQATKLYSRALSGAVHKDQVSLIVKKLRAADVDIDLQAHFGFLTQWYLIGPFDNRDMKGFAVEYPPESEIDLDAQYEGQRGQVSWQRLTTEDDYGVVDIGKQIENYKGSVMYATCDYESESQQAVELRLGTPNAWKLWLNGELVFQREEYHRSTRMDQYKLPVTLQSGTNTILLKICQNEQTQSWAQAYRFQLRVCDSAGAAVLAVPKTSLLDRETGSSIPGGLQR